jgi:hypothetical protein
MHVSRTTAQHIHIHKQHASSGKNEEGLSSIYLTQTMKRATRVTLLLSASILVAIQNHVATNELSKSAEGVEGECVFAMCAAAPVL